jgi:LuxR family transcriptional regulator, quorum-sensing system regulator BjaR1
MPPIKARHEISRDAFGFVESLEGLTTVDEVADAFARAVSRCGVKHFMATGACTMGQPFEDLVIASNWPAELFMLYVENEYARFDPLIRRSAQSYMPFEWQAASYRMDGDPRAVEIMRREARHGLNHGYLVPIHGPDGYEGCVSMAADTLDLSARAKLALHLVALYGFDRMRRLRDSMQGKRLVLTAREREVLSWAGAGKSAAQIGRALKISKRTVDEHSQTAARKLGAANRTQAVAIALRDRIIHFQGVPNAGGL